MRASSLQTFSLLLLVAASLSLTSCDRLGTELTYRPQAVGREGVITVVTDTTTWQGPVGDAIRAALAPPMRTMPTFEPVFALDQVSMSNELLFEQAKKQKNVVFVAPINGRTNESRFLRSRFDSSAVAALEQGGGVAILREDLWRRSQRVYYVTAGSEEGLQQTLAREAEEMRAVFNKIARERTQADIFERKRQLDLEERLMEQHGFAVNVQHDYQIAIDTTNFVWLRRILTDTWRSLFVYYEENADPGDLTPEWMQETRDRLTRQYVQGNLGGWVTIDYRRPLETVNLDDFMGRFAFESRGLWHMIGPGLDGEIGPVGGGGPYLSYAFYDQPTGRLYLIDGMVFAPNFSKREFLRQMEAIAYTFRTREEAEATAVAQATE